MSETKRTPTNGPVLQMQGVHTHIGAYHILHGVDFTVMPGQTALLLGRNGAGKTTALRTIMGLWQASSGSIVFDGRELVGTPTPAIASQGIAYVPENMAIFGELTVADNLALAARSVKNARQLDDTRLQSIFGFFPALKRFWTYPAGLLSGGQKQMLAIARAMVEPRTLVLIDEPSKGLAPSMVEQLCLALLSLKAQGTTIVLVEQNIQLAQRLGDTVAIMDDGRIVHAGEVKALIDDPSLQARLLGLSLTESHG